MQSEKMQQVVWLAIVGVCSFCTGVLLALGLMLTIDSPRKREEQLKQEVAGLRPQVAELQTSLAKEVTKRESVLQDMEHQKQTTNRVLGELKAMEARIREDNHVQIGTRAEVLAAIQSEFATKDLDVNGETTVEVAGGRVVLTFSPTEGELIHSVMIFGTPNDYHYFGRAFVLIMREIGHIELDKDDVEWLTSALKYSVANPWVTISRTLGTLRVTVSYLKVGDTSLISVRLESPQS
jgi:hypothetical protein